MSGDGLPARVDLGRRCFFRKCDRHRLLQFAVGCDQEREQHDRQEDQSDG
ncbi:MAG: hypothetical protein MZV63_06920 [Marinilabiliales bacterium]|nr:hypothetical protein [Marinilabiliales bacterium]